MLDLAFCTLWNTPQPTMRLRPAHSVRASVGLMTNMPVPSTNNEDHGNRRECMHIPRTNFAVFLSEAFSALGCAGFSAANTLPAATNSRIWDRDHDGECVCLCHASCDSVNILVLLYQHRCHKQALLFKQHAQLKSISN